MELSTKVWSLTTSEKVSLFRQAACDRLPWNGCEPRLSKDHDFKIFLAFRKQAMSVSQNQWCDMWHDATKRLSDWLLCCYYNTQRARTSISPGPYQAKYCLPLFTDTVTTAFDSRAQCPSRLNVSAGASVSSDSHGFGPRNCLSSSSSDSSWLKPRANQKKIQTSLQSLAEALVGLLLLVSSTLAAGDAWTDFSSERFHWRFMVFQGFSGSIPCSPSGIIVRHSPGVSLGASPGVGEPSSVSNYGCDGCDRFINSDLFTFCWCFLVLQLAFILFVPVRAFDDILHLGHRTTLLPEPQHTCWCFCSGGHKSQQNKKAKLKVLIQSWRCYKCLVNGTILHALDTEATQLLCEESRLQNQVEGDRLNDSEMSSMLNVRVALYCYILCKTVMKHKNVRIIV